MSWLTDCEPVKMTEASALQIQMCDLLKGTIQIAKRDLKKTTWSVMPTAALAALLTCCCAEGCDSIERVGRGTDGGRSFSMCTHLQHSEHITYMFFFVYTSIAKVFFNMLFYLLTCFCTNLTIHRSLFRIIFNLICSGFCILAVSESLSQMTCILIYDFSNILCFQMSNMKVSLIQKHTYILLYF